MTTPNILRRLGSWAWSIPETSFGAYFGATVLSVAAVAGRYAMMPVVSGLQFVTLFPAVLVSSLLFGWRAGLWCGVLGGLGTWFLLIAPALPVKTPNVLLLAALMLYVTVAGLIAASVGALRGAVRRGQEASARLAAERQLLMSVFEALPVGISLADGSGKVTYLNPAALAIHGYGSMDEALEEMARTTRRLKLTTLEGEPVPPQLWPRQQAVDGRFVKDFEVRMTFGEHERLASFTALPLSGEVDDIRIVLVTHDITARKEAEEHQRLLVNELNHRVKNTLATVQSIARQTMKRATSVADFHEAFEARLTALSQTHNVLTAGRWEKARLADLLTQEMQPFPRDQVRVSGPDIEVSAPLALSLGMIFHELATNAAKYGALSTPAGCVHVDWTVGDDGGLRLEWRETDGPAVVAPTATGFGSLLVERSLTAHGGRAKLSFPAEGARCTIEAPLHDASLAMTYAFG